MGRGKSSLHFTRQRQKRNHYKTGSNKAYVLMHAQAPKNQQPLVQISSQLHLTVLGEILSSKSVHMIWLEKL